MSLDLYVNGTTTCPHCRKAVPLDTEAWSRNITHNVTEMWRKAGVYEALYESDGHQCKEYTRSLEYGLTAMLESFADYKLLDAANGWGRAEHALAFLWDAYRTFRDNPEGVIHVSK